MTYLIDTSCDVKVRLKKNKPKIKVIKKKKHDCQIVIIPLKKKMAKKRLT